MKSYSARKLSTALVLALCFVVFAAVAVYADEGLVTDRDTLSMTEVNEVRLEANFGYTPNPDNLRWYFGPEGEHPRSFSAWRQWDLDRGARTGEPLIEFTEGPEISGDSIRATIEIGLFWGTDSLTDRSIRPLFKDEIGDYVFVVQDLFTGASVSTSVFYNAYESFTSWDDTGPTIDEIIANTQADRHIEYISLGESTEGRDIHFVVLARDEEAVRRYREEMVPAMLENPGLLQEQLASGELNDYQVPVWFHNTHPDESPAYDAILELMETLATEDSVSFEAPLEYERHSETGEVTLDVDSLLDDIIFLFTPTRNPDGRHHMTRGSIYEQMDPSLGAFDLNRDASYQTQPASRYSTAALSDWLPLVFLDLHGFYYPAVVDLLTPPHDPNYEYDLVHDAMELHPFAMGETMLANTYYEEYVIPGLDWDWGWDDSSAIYAPTHAMHFGALLSHTIEIQELAEESVWSTYYVGLGSAMFIQDEKDRLYANQLEYFRRGVEGVDDRAADEYFVDWPSLEPIGRDRGEHDNFFPEYYVLPVDETLQSNPLEAHNMVEYLLRNGVRVEITEAPVTVDGTTYPAGSFVVPMRQALRGFANTVLFDGPDHSQWPQLYATVIQNFHHLWGFDRDEIRLVGAFDGVTATVESVEIPSTEVEVGEGPYVIRNANNDAVRAVNALLAEGESVGMIVEEGTTHGRGDFVVSAEALEGLLEEHLLHVLPFDGGARVEPLQQPRVAVAGVGTVPAQTRFVLEHQLGFDIVDPEDAHIIVDKSGSAERTWIDEGKSYIGIGGSALEWVEENMPELVAAGFSWESTGSAHEGVVHSDLSETSMITAGYDPEEILYINTGSWISSVPESARVIGSVADDDDFFIAGFWDGREAARGEALIMQDWFRGANITLFANSLTNQGHPRQFYRFLTNTIYGTYLPGYLSN